MSLIKPWDRNIAFFKAENYIKNVKFLKIPDRDRKNIIGATTMAAAMFSFSLLSIPVDARPAIESCTILRDVSPRTMPPTKPPNLRGITQPRCVSPANEKTESVFGSIGSISLDQ